MAHWLALLANPSSLRTEVTGVALWAMQFTPRVAYLDESVVLEVEGSLQLFGGEDALQARIAREAGEVGVARVSRASTSLAALALARSDLPGNFSAPVNELLDPLPLASISAVAVHQPTLARLGCRTLGDVRGLPRGGLSRRFDKQVLTALDQAYGLVPSAHQWLTLPESFCIRLELPGRVTTSAALVFGAHRLLLQLCGWLAARNSGVSAFALRWRHDAMRSREAGEGGELIIRTAWASRDIHHLARLLSEHLAKVKLLAPVGDLELAAIDVSPMLEKSRSLLPDEVAADEALGFALERIAARLSDERVLRPRLLEDHRLEWMQSWSHAAETAKVRAKNAVHISLSGSTDLPQPTWVFHPPLRLAVTGHRPMYQGLLQLVAGPHRVEGGWWHRQETDDKRAQEGQALTHNVQRDYWVALSEHAGALWIFQERLAHDDISWYLHGVFA